MAFRELTALAAVVAVTAMWVATSATAQAGQTCSDLSNPLANLDYSDAGVKACVVARCVATLNATPTTTSNGYCNGEPTSESSVPCYQLEVGYSAYYICLMRALQGTKTPGLIDVGAAATRFFNTPGFPYHLSLLGCYACNHFRLTVFPSLGSSCSNWTCGAVSSQSPSAPGYGQPDEGYNHRLCSTGCIAGIMMIPFTVAACAIFFACGCCWPSPLLKTTYKTMLEEEEEKYRKRFDENNPSNPVGLYYSGVNEPAPAANQKRHSEVVLEYP
ncbi:hypothetical protein LPMP_100210 [Leishmania panamensis]|uniref:Uncharacterized protein n=3 Tax=Leishmania guyanensis species complex TaxID=38579 RepID=A0A088RJV7_LEIPA|nr:hypothetical protein LPMP_100210 [Leishmania panamensis]AIN96090.1 hypothetical protein LPMP_100210 [Leishmania panamensis]CCM13468.1 hypothetical protein, unknown function [Leishmania guyanensis]